MVLSSVAMSSAPTTAPAERELAAGERGAADDDGEDRVELHLVAGAATRRPSSRCRREDAGDAGEDGAQDVDVDQQAARPDAGDAGSPSG